MKGWNRDNKTLVNTVETSLRSLIVTMAGNDMDWNKTGQKTTHKFVLAYDTTIQLVIY